MSDQSTNNRPRDYDHGQSSSDHDQGHLDHSDSHSHSYSDFHNHQGHNHDHSVSLENINLSFIIAVSANLAFTIIEAIYAVIANSVSLLGDAGHNLSDVLGLLLAWGATYLASQKATDFYSYGYRRTTILAAIINAVVLVFAALYIAYVSIDKFFAPSEISEVAMMIVASIGIAVNAGTAMLFVKGQDDLNLRGAFLHLAYDALISAGVVVAAIIIYFSGWLWVDPAMGLLIVIVILGGTWGMLRDSINLILDAVPQGIDRHAVHDFLAQIPGVSQVHDLHIWGMSTYENCLTAHLVMPENTLWDSEESYAAIGALLRKDFNIHHVTLQIEKDQECSNQDCD
ncbi:MAG: cation diffusion facilitator family transporter [Pseudomonadales bacterium]